MWPGQNEQQTMQPPLEDGGVIERLMRNKLCTRQSVSSTGKELQIVQQPRQRNTDIEEHEILYRSTKLRSRIQISKVHLSIWIDLRYRNTTPSDIEVLNFDINVSSISYCFDIDVPCTSISKLHRYRTASISKFLRI